MRWPPNLSSSGVDQVLGQGSIARSPAGLAPALAGLGTWRETISLVLAGALIVGIMTRPAFQAFFFGEAFLYLGQFQAHGGHFIRALLSPSDVVFFKPVLFAASLPWYFLFPPDPWLYHARNFAFIVINLLLMHRILVYLVRSLYVRLVSLTLFALSKIHLTTIGYLMIFDSIVMLMLLFLTVLFFLRFMAHRRPYDYVLGLLCCFLSLFTKDYGLVVVAVVAALVATVGPARPDWRTAIWRRGRWLAPLPFMVLLQLGLRFSIVGPLPTGAESLYAPSLRFEGIALKAYVLASAFSNLSLSQSGTVGRPGLGTLAGKIVPPLAGRAGWVDGVALIALLALLLVTLRYARRAGWLIAVPLVWAAVYFAPAVLTRNVQIYYAHESLAGLAVALGLCLDHAGRRLRAAWGLALVLIGISGLVSNYTSLYAWQYAANASRQVEQAVVLPQRGKLLHALTFVSAPVQRPFWEWVLTADTKGPMLQVLLGLPQLQVRFADSAALTSLLAEAGPLTPVVDIDDNFALYDQPGTVERGPLGLVRLSPDQTEVGVAFNRQPDGQSALVVSTANATRTSVVVLNSRPLPTTYGGPMLLTALVPADVVATPGVYPVYVIDGEHESNRLDFVVRPGR